MRTTWMAMAAGLGLCAVACGGGSSGTSGTTTTTGGTTGGGTTGTVLLAAGAPCAANPACASGVCGIDGTGNCCAAACELGGGGCGATACDATGACKYPAAGTSCGTTVCSEGSLLPSICDGAGACDAGAPLACPLNYACLTDGGCNTSCNSVLDCADGFVCNHKTCQMVQDFGACSENDDCGSGICGITGSGHCCTVGCTVGAPCGATDCDNATGDCIYADAGTSCGSQTQSCSGNMQTLPEACDGNGGCGQQGNPDCTPYVCGPTACLTSCQDNTSCGSQDFCDVPNSTCCSGLFAGALITVDSNRGDDSTPCCGVGGRPPCKTLAKVMASIDAAQAPNVFISAAVNGMGGDWLPPGEVYPIKLGWGAELSAPGVFFSDLGEVQAEIFDIAPYSANDTVGYASISGSAPTPVGIGMTQAGIQSQDLSAIQVEKGQTLYLSTASVNGNAVSHTTALTVAAGGALTLGTDQSATVTGTVTIGNNLNAAMTDGWNGVVCEFDNTAATGCTITDAPLKLPSVVIQGQEGLDIDAENYASILLSSAPVIGIPPPAAGFGKCGKVKPDGSGMGLGAGEAVLLHGSASMTFDNGVVQCIAANGFELQSTNKGVPSLTLDSTTIQNTETAIYASAGAATISDCTIQFNYNGVVESFDNTHSSAIDLGASVDGGVNTVVCSSKKESVNASPINPGVCVLNQTNSALNASDVDWDTAGPDVFSCGSLSSCTCPSSSCTDSPGADGMDAAYQSLGKITTTNNGLSATKCM